MICLSLHILCVNVQWMLKKVLLLRNYMLWRQYVYKATLAFACITALSSTWLERSAVKLYRKTNPRIRVLDDL